MNNLQPVGTTISAPQPEIVKKLPQNNMRSVNFKADRNDQFVRRENRRPPVYTQPPMFDPQIQMQKMLEEQKAKQKKQERWQKIGLGVSIGAGLAIIATLILSLTGKGDKTLSNMTTTALKWKDLKGTDAVASLNSDTTSPALKDSLNKIISKSKLSDEARSWTGVKDGAEIIYLYGHGGTGKSYAAEQFAQEKGALFACIKYPDLGSPFKDAASMKITDFFDKIVEKSAKHKDRDIVVCIDEIDAVLRKVNDNAANGAEEAAKTRAAVLTGLDKVRKECKNVTIIATSNYHPKNGIVDPIALRRFNNHVEVPLPDEKQNLALMKMYLKDIGAIDPDKFFKSKDVIKFAETLKKEGYANGEIELICKEAQKIFGEVIEKNKVSDTDLKKYAFQVKYLEEAKKLKGSPASKTNNLMNAA
ncbi:MAG: AAA family ATPase [Cyanobacteria bacterium SIG28]|nr:AAA family ATPase [Cyanobacteria bacterium SIG28]